MVVYKLLLPDCHIANDIFITSLLDCLFFVVAIFFQFAQLKKAHEKAIMFMISYSKWLA